MSNKKEAYLYISAMLRARETRMLTREKAERMLDAPSFEESAKILADCGYEDMSQMSAREIDQALAAHRDTVFKELAGLAPNETIVDVFRIKYDYHNAKVILKAEAMNSDESGLMSGSGRVAPQAMLAAYNEDRCRDLPGGLGAAMEEAKGVLARSANPQLADFVLDKAYFAELAGLAEALDSEFLTGYVAILADSTNLKSAVRTLRMGKGQDFLREVLIPDGNVGAERVANATDKDSLAALYAHSALEKAAVLGGEALSGGSMTAFELACDNAVNDYLKGARLISYGCEVPVAYMAAVEGEITAIRMILTGRLAGVPSQTIRERLRDLYV